MKCVLAFHAINCAQSPKLEVICAPKTIANEGTQANLECTYTVPNDVKVKGVTYDHNGVGQGFSLFVDFLNILASSD